MPGNGSVSIKRGDIILIMILLLAALIAFALIKAGQRGGDTVHVTVNGKDYGSWPLQEEKIIRIEEEGGRNVLKIHDGKAYMSEADCRDLICVHHAPVSHVGESIICLPHKVVVTVEAEEKEGTEKTTEGSFDAVSE